MHPIRVIHDGAQGWWVNSVRTSRGNDSIAQVVIAEGPRKGKVFNVAVEELDVKVDGRGQLLFAQL